MNNKIQQNIAPMTIGSGFFIKTGLIVATLAIMSVPAVTHAASYAYVSVDGFVKSVIADNSAMAMILAPGRHPFSGVLLLDSEADREVVGDYVSGL
jgi:hypothetical protein